METKPLITFVNSEGERKNLFECYPETELWEVERGAKVMKHVAIQRLARSEGISLVDVKPIISPTSDNLQQHGVVVYIKNKKGDISAKTGEASRLNTGKWIKSKNAEGKEEVKYVEKEDISARYRLVMAEKRAFDRAVFEELQIWGVYSDEEAEAFKESIQKQEAEKAKKAVAPENFNY